MIDLDSDWALWLQMRSCRPNTIAYHKTYLRLTFTNLNLKWEDFGNREKMYTGWEKVWKLDISNNTKRKYLITMRLYADFLISKKLVEVNYPREMKVPRVQKALPFCMGRDNYIHIYNAIHRRWGTSDLGMRNKMIFDTILYTGIRREELTKILKSDIEPTKITVRDGKGGKMRVIYLPEHFSLSLHTYMKKTNGEYLFTSRTSEKLTPSGISVLFQTLRKVSGISVYPHMLRHDYASNCLRAGVDIYTTASQMGHSRISTTELYLCMNDEDKLQKMQLLK